MLIKQKPPKERQIASLINPGSNVLDVGCGSGALAPLLIEKECTVDGLDIKLNLIEANKRFYRNLWSADIEKLDFKKIAQQYDVVIFSDVLEHLKDPDIVLAKTKKLLTKHGKVIISLPNVAYFSIRLELLCGFWNYKDQGIMDRTHLRFFTLSTAKCLIVTSGYSIKVIDPEIAIINSKWKRVVFSYLCDWLPTLFALGWVFEAVPQSES